MATLPGRSLVPMLLIVGSSLTIAGAQTPPAPRPEQEALSAAVAIKDPAARLDALEKIRADFPQGNLGPVDAQMLSTLVNNFPDRVDGITTVFERIIGRIPTDAAPEVRLSQTLTPVALVVPRRLLLDRSEKLVSDALAGMDLEKYVQAQRELAKRANRPEPAQAQLEGGFNAACARALEQLARIQMAQAEENLKASIKLNPAFGTAQPALAEMYLAKGDAASAEAVYKDAIKTSTTPAAASRASVALADFYLKRGDVVSAEAQIKETLKTNPMYMAALLALARIEDKRGDSNARARALSDGRQRRRAARRRRRRRARALPQGAWQRGGFRRRARQDLPREVPEPREARAVPSRRLVQRQQSRRPARDVHRIGLRAVRLRRSRDGRGDGAVFVRRDRAGRVSREHPAARSDGRSRRRRPARVLQGARRADVQHRRRARPARRRRARQHARHLRQLHRQDRQRARGAARRSDQPLGDR